MGDPSCLYSGCIWSTPGNQAKDQWFQFDLGPQSSRSPLIYSALYLRSSNASNYPRDFKVQTSNDGSTWTTVVAAGKGSQYLTIPLGIQSARYARVTLTAAAAAPWDVFFAFVES